MTTYKCEACGGEYDDLNADGTRYFHTCAPLTRVRVRRAGEELELELAEVREGDERIAERQVERPGARDENLNAADRDEQGRARLRREGRGRTIVRR